MATPVPFWNGSDSRNIAQIIAEVRENERYKRYYSIYARLAHLLLPHRLRKALCRVPLAILTLPTASAKLMYSFLLTLNCAVKGFVLGEGGINANATLPSTGNGP